ncbi:MAG: rod shape-determining protein MreC, partial [Pseudomonadota bacterium]
SGDAFGRSMIVNAGRARNVEAGQAVVDDQGFIGRVVDAGTRASRVLLLTDSQSRVPVFVEGAEVEGILVGNSKDRPTISFTRDSEPREVIQGQRILTSGAGGVLPRGLPVGEVVNATGSDIAVDLFANYAMTRMVRIINYEFPEPGADGAVEENAAIGDDTITSDTAATADEPSAPAPEG